MRAFFVEVTGMTGYFHLIRLLEILLPHKIIRNLCRKGIKRNPFQMPGKGDISCNLQHFFKGKHKFYRRT